MEEVRFPGLVSEMAKKGDTYTNLADLLKLSVSSISRRFSGEVDWSIGEIGVICEHYRKKLL